MSLSHSNNPRRYLSPLQVSRSLGVGETTVKRWCDDGRLPFQRTAGGHRRILVEDVLEMVRRENLPHVSLEELQLDSASSIPPDPQALFAPFLNAVLRSETETASTLLLNAHQAGLSVPILGDELIAPIMSHIGHGWARGEIDVYQEHRSTQVCLSALLALKSRFDSRGPVSLSQPLAIGGGPEFDHYLLANLLIEMTFHELGWRVVNIGPNTPMTSFRRAIRELKPRVLWLSCSHLSDEAGFLSGFRTLYEEASVSGVAVAVGGRALTEPIRQRMTFTHYGDRLSHLAAFARELQNRR